MHENFKLCEKLKPHELCIVIERYNEGDVSREFHEHLPSVRLSKDAQGQLLRALVIRFSAMSARTIVRNHLNTRGKSPPAENDLRFHQTYPEPGVIRFYCGGNIKAWSDKVILPSQFRQG
jgi:hypothetical protein